MKTAKMLFLLMAVAYLAGGCTTVAKEGLALATGPSGKYAEVKSTPSLKDYRNFEVGQFKDKFGRTPATLMNMIPTEIRKDLREAKLPVGKAGRTLVIQGEVLYFEKAGVLDSVEEVVTEITLVEKSSGQTVGMALCVGRSTKMVNRGIEKKAQGVAKAIIKWIKSKRK